MLIYFFIEEFPKHYKNVKKTENYNVALIKINYRIDINNADKIIEKINQAETDNKAEAILFEINSPGGYVYPSAELESIIRNCQKYKVAYIRAIGTSGAYLAASATDFILATKLSNVGSIAVDGSYKEVSEKNSNEGITFNNLITGKYKNMRDENVPLSPEEKKMIMDELMILHHYFVEQVAINRNVSVDSIMKIADGRDFRGEEALELKLIDKIVENMNDVKEELKLKLNQKIVFKEF
jgi:protease-4